MNRNGHRVNRVTYMNLSVNPGIHLKHFKRYNNVNQVRDLQVFTQITTENRIKRTA